MHGTHLYNLARIMNAETYSHIDKRFLSEELGFSQLDAKIMVWRTPDERMAYHIGDIVESWFNKMTYEEFKATDGEVPALFAAKCKKMSFLTPYVSSTEDTKRFWRDIALALCAPESPDIDQLQQLPTDQKVSLQEALTDHANDLHKRGDPPSAKAAALALFQIYDAYTIEELFPVDEENKVISVNLACVSSPVLRDAFMRWGTMDNAERKTTIQAVIDQHAEIFDYGEFKLEVTLESLGAQGVSGRTDTHSLTINADSTSFSNLPDAMNTVFRESTHRYQSIMVSRRLGEVITAGTPLYNLSRIMSAESASQINERTLSEDLEFSELDASIMAKRTPCERMTSHIGDYVKKWFDNVVPKPPKTGEKQ